VLGSPEAMRMRVLGLIASCFLGALVIVVLATFGKSSAGSITAERERALMQALKTPWNPATRMAQQEDLDTNTIPLLARALQTRPGTVDKIYALAWSNAPLAIRSNLPAPLDSAAAEQVRLRASALLAGPKIRGSVQGSTLIKELQDPFWGVRMNALACLNNPAALGEEEGRVFALVLAAAQDPQMEVRMSAIYCLGYFKDAPDQVVPILSKALNDNSPDVRIRAAMAFYEFNPVAAEKAGALTVAFDCLHSNGPHGSGHLAADFLKKEGKLAANGP
jgi:hypothetical protein